MRHRRDVHYTEANNTDWSLRNRLLTINVHISEDWGGYERPLAGFTHTFNSLLSRSEFEAHPEYFMVKDGKRDPHQLCLTSPDVRRIIIDKTLDRLRKDPAARYRHRYYRKGKYVPAKIGGQIACVGCGRCITACVANIANPVEVFNRLAEGN